MKKLLIIFIININLFALNTIALNKIKTAWDFGKHTKAKDGMTFEYAISGIMGQESSWGKAVVGDKYTKTGKLKDLYESSLGNFQIKISTAKLTIKKIPYLKKKYKYLIYDGNSIYKKYISLNKKLIKLEATSYKNISCENKNYNKMSYYYKIYNNKSWNNKAKNNNKKAIKTLIWAKRKYEEYKKKYNKALFERNLKFSKKEKELQIKIKDIKNKLSLLKLKANKDTLLINKLLIDFKFGSEIASNYLKLIYEEALNKKLKNPYKRAIGRYNGGWNNMVYYNKIKNRVKTIRKLEKNKKIKLI
jgi:hypothetical protein